MFWVFLGKLQKSFLTITKGKVSNFLYPSRCTRDCDKTCTRTGRHTSIARRGSGQHQGGTSSGGSCVDGGYAQPRGLGAHVACALAKYG